MVANSPPHDTESTRAVDEQNGERIPASDGVALPADAASEREHVGSSASPERRSNPSARVAIFTPALDFGGAQRVTVTIANSLAQRGWDVDLVAGHLEGEFLSAVDDAVNTVDLDIPRVPGLGILAGVPALVAYLRASNPAVLIAGRTHANLAAILAGAISGTDVHVAVTEHSAIDQGTSLKSRLTVALASYLYRYADDVIGVSEGVAENVVETTQVSPDQTTVLNNPVDIDDIQTKATEPVDHPWLTDPDLDPIVSVGRLKPIKDYPTLLDAFAVLTEQRPETRLIIVGKGPERERLAAQATDLGIADRVSLPGYTDNPYAYMHHASVFVLSSKEEGLPTALIEALACGCTVVSTDCEYGPREILVGGEYGRLTPVGDADALAQALADALDDPIPTEIATERAEYFSMESGADRYEAYIRNATDDC